MNAGLQEAVTGLYRVFRRYPAKTVHACDHCHTAEEQQRLNDALFSRQLAHLEVDDLAGFAGSAPYVIGDLADFKHFLPRLLELLPAASHRYGFEPDVVLGKLEYLKWSQWPGDEQTAIRNFMKAHWSSILAGRYPDLKWGSYFQDCVVGLAHAGEDIEPYLQEWSRADSFVALHCLANFLHENARYFISPEEKSVRWKAIPQAREKAGRLLMTAAVSEKLEDAYLHYADEENADDIALAADILRAAL